MSDNAARHRAQTPRGRRVRNRILIGVAVLVVLVSTTLYVAYKHLEGNINPLDVSGDLGNRPDKVKVKGQDQPMNVLVMGDDTRKGQGPAIGGSTPGLSDTTILLHVSANRKFAYGVSLPRDAMVQRPSCKSGSGETSPAGLTQFNSAYAIGGPGCTMKTVEHLTGIHIDHFVVIKFSGFKQMVDAIGGVTVCVPKAIDDNYKNSNIHLPEGTYKVDGEQALNYVRERHAVGDGSDTGRIRRQQAFIASMVKRVMSAGTLANPVHLYKFLNAATKSLTTDPGFAHLNSLASLGKSLQNIGLDKVSFVTVPFEAYPSDPNRIQWGPDASRLWDLVKYDKQLGPKFTKDAFNASRAPGGKPTVEGSPSASGSPSKAGTPSSGGSSPSAPTTSTGVPDAEQYGLCS